ncbi:DASH complex subunit Dad3-domain-containing protein [Coniochaeta sp. 2T2.1]|nr:DASH complex subunit Dad3-domain-containing protein [Coniochaeta sp. 2T2.1]
MTTTTYLVCSRPSPTNTGWISSKRYLPTPGPTLEGFYSLEQNHALLAAPELSPLEQEVLDEYERLAENMKKLATQLDDLASAPATDILDGLRELERKTSLVFTLLKASVYSIVLQQEIDWGGQNQNNQAQ